MPYPWLTFPTTPEHQAELVASEIEWEIEGVQRGIDRVRQMRAEAEHRAVTKDTGGLADMDAGAVMLREIVSPLIPAIERLQEEALKGLHQRGSRARWWLPILCLESEKWAVIIVRSVLVGLTSELKDSRPATPLAIKICNHAMLQREFDLWRKRQVTKHKESGGEVIDLYKLMISRVKRVNERTVRKWMRLTEDVDRLDWSKEDKVHTGLRLLDLLVTDGGGWFEIALVGRGVGRMRQTTRHVRLTLVAKDWLKRYEAASELHRPFLAPMLCPPDPWRWQPDGAHSGPRVDLA